MTETMTGEVVFAQVGIIPATGERYGFITIKTADDKKVELKIDDSTEHGLLLSGTKVTVEYENENDSDRPLATKIVNKTKTQKLF